MKTKFIIAALALAFSATAALAAPTAVVEGVQMPAWVQRNGIIVPIAAGMELQAADKVTTGPNSRLLLRLAEGSQVKLGENAELSLSRLTQSQENKQTFLQAAMEVARGAFRFTTDARAKLISRRAVDIRVATVTAGIRGTDLWGKSAGDRDIVCLIEGKIEVRREQDAPIAMDQALQFYIAPKNSEGKADRTKPDPVLAAVDAQQLAQWSLETEIAAGQGAARMGGKWKVVAADSPNQGDALKVYDQLRAAGYAAQIHPVGSADKRSYEVRIGGLPSREEADALGTKVEAVTGSKPRVSA
jgi:hypothetical protein